EHHGIVGVVRYGSPRSDRGQSGSLSPAQPMIDHVVVQVGSASAAPGREALAQHLDYLVEFASCETAERVGAADHLEQLVFNPFRGGTRRNDLLSKYVQSLLRNRQLIELAPANRIQQRRAFDQLVAT